MNWALCERKGTLIVAPYATAKENGWDVHGISRNRAHMLALQDIQEKKAIVKTQGILTVIEGGEEFQPEFA